MYLFILKRRRCRPPPPREDRRAAAWQGARAPGGGVRAGTGSSPRRDGFFEGLSLRAGSCLRGDDVPQAKGTPTRKLPGRVPSVEHRGVSTCCMGATSLWQNAPSWRSAVVLGRAFSGLLDLWGKSPRSSRLACNFVADIVFFCYPSFCFFFVVVFFFIVICVFFLYLRCI